MDTTNVDVGLQSLQQPGPDLTVLGMVGSG